MAVLPSADSATDWPCTAIPTTPVPTSLVPCWFQAPPLRVKIHTAPVSELSVDPPTMAVLPSADSATEEPSPALPTAPLPTSFGPCCKCTWARASCDDKSSAAETRINATNNFDGSGRAITRSPPKGYGQTQPVTTPARTRQKGPISEAHCATDARNGAQGDCATNTLRA